MKNTWFHACAGWIGVVALCGVLAGAGSLSPGAWGQELDGVKRVPVPDDKPDPTRRGRSDAEKIRTNKAMKEELKGSYKTWVDQDVKWIISDEELTAFKHLGNDLERDQFIENFWLRRNPNPESPENEYREEHYARIAYANEHFAAGKSGWRTDRGHMYIAYGKPDSVSTRTRAAETMNGRWKRAAAIPPRFRSRSGTTGTLRESATTSISSL